MVAKLLYISYRYITRPESYSNNNHEGLSEELIDFMMVAEFNRILNLTLEVQSAHNYHYVMGSIYKLSIYIHPSHRCLIV